MPRTLPFAFLLCVACGSGRGAGAQAARGAGSESPDEGSTVELLEGRLVVTVPEGGHTRPAPHSVMGSPEPDAIETTVWLEAGDDQLAMRVNESFRTCDDDFRAQVVQLLEADPTPEPRTIRRLAHAGAPEAWVVEPEELDRRGDVARLLRAYLCTDGTVQRVQFMIAGDLDRLEAPSRRIANQLLDTLRSGPRPRRLAAHTAELEAYAGVIRVALPDGWTSYTREGADFRVFYVVQVAAERGAEAMMYIGDRPRGAPGGEITGSLFGREASWRRRDDEHTVALEHVGPAPAGIGTGAMHIVLRSPSPEGLAALQRAFAAARITSRAP